MEKNILKSETAPNPSLLSKPITYTDITTFNILKCILPEIFLSIFNMLKFVSNINFKI